MYDSQRSSSPPSSQLTVGATNLSHQLQDSWYLDILLCYRDNPLSHEYPIVLKEFGIFLSILLALVNEELDQPLLQNISELPAAETSLLKIAAGPRQEISDEHLSLCSVLVMHLQT